MATPNYGGWKPGAAPDGVVTSDRGCGEAQPQLVQTKHAAGASKPARSMVAAAAGLRHSRGPFLRPLFRVHLSGCFLPLFFLTALSAAFAATEISQSECEKHARRDYWHAHAAHTNQIKDVKPAWEFARACFDVGEFATNSNERAEIAEQGINICRELISRDPNLVQAHYYLGMNLGQLARTRGLSALKLVGEMEKEFKRARELDEKWDSAGPDRNLGLLYKDAPRVASIGSRSKAQRHLQRAVEVAPNFPENRLNLIEADLYWSDRNGAKRELKALEELWPKALTALSGPEWACSWMDWKKRLGQVKKKTQEPSKAIESPRQKD